MGWFSQGHQLVAAQIVGAAFHVADAQLAEQGFEKGNVAEEELVLQRLGAGRNNDALAGAQGGQQVGKGFAGARAGLDNQVAALGEGALHGLGHFQLAGPVLVRQRRTRQNAAGREELVQAGQGAGCGVGRRHRKGAASIIVRSARPAHVCAVRTATGRGARLRRFSQSRIAPVAARGPLCA